MIRNRAVFIFVFLAVYGLSLAAAKIQRAVYEATATVRSLDHPAALPSSLLIKAKAVTSWPVMQEVAVRLGFIREEDPSEEVQARVAEVQSKITVLARQPEGLLDIKASADRAELAAGLANATAEVFQQKDVEEAKRFAREQQAFFERRSRVSLEKIEMLGKQLQALREKESELQAAAALKDELSDLEGRRQRLLEKFTPRHPDIIDLEKQINYLEAEIASFPADDQERLKVENELHTEETNYRTLQEQYQKAQLHEAAQTGSVRIVQLAQVPKSPAYPNWALYHITGSILGLVLGFLVALLFRRS